MTDWLPSVCAGLHAAGGAGTVAAQHLLDLAWLWAEKAIRSALGGSLPSQRDQQLTALGEPLAALLSAAAAIGAASTADPISHYVRKQDDSVVALEMSALRAASGPVIRPERPGVPTPGSSSWPTIAPPVSAPG